MLKKIDIDDLTVGMHVILPLSWYEHDFLKNQFTVTSEKQIAKIKESGLTQITIDPTQGLDIPLGRMAYPLPDESSPRETIAEILLDGLMEAIHDGVLAAKNKAEAVHKQSMIMIKKLLENPSAQNIQVAKRGIAEVVNLILLEEATAFNLLRITTHDYYTYTHSVSVGILAISLSKVLFRRSHGHDMHELGAGFFLHDLGKVSIDPAILNKPGRLTPDEMQEMRRHPNLGFKMLSQTNQLSNECKLIVLEHHEKYDGKGYPKGLKGNTIHIYGRICALADVYDALTSVRPYRKALRPFKALKMMKEEMIGHFEQELFEELVLLLK